MMKLQVGRAEPQQRGFTNAQDVAGWIRATYSSQVSATEWARDAEADTCSVCSTAFTAINRRHHCRPCGKLVCGGCSSHRLAAARACDPCFAASTDDDGREWQGAGHADAVTSSVSDLRESVRELGEHALSGLLPKTAALFTAPVAGAMDDGLSGFASGLEKGAAGFAKSGLRTVGLMTKGGMAFGKFGYACARAGYGPIAGRLIRRTHTYALH